MTEDAVRNALSADDPSSRPDLSILTVNSNTLEISWPSIPGNRYQRTSGPNLQTWSNLLSVVATDERTRVQVPRNDMKGFFQVIASAP